MEMLLDFFPAKSTQVINKLFCPDSVGIVTNLGRINHFSYVLLLSLSDSEWLTTWFVYIERITDAYSELS